jgi:hypothetical protein
MNEFAKSKYYPLKTSNANLAYSIGFLFLISILLNIYLLSELPYNSNEHEIEAQIPETSNIAQIPTKSKKKEKTFSVYIKPHPPLFLEGRIVYFTDFQVSKENNKNFVVFTEIQDGATVKTKVESEEMV